MYLSPVCRGIVLDSELNGGLMASDFGNNAWKLAPIDIKTEALLPVLRRLQDGAHADNKEIEFTGGFGMIPVLYLDRNKIRTVFMNLLSNAVKYSTPGTKISILVHSDKGWVITFAFYGASIPEEICDCMSDEEYGTTEVTTDNSVGEWHGLLRCITILSEMGSWIKIVQNGNPVAVSFWLPRFVSQDQWR